MKENDNAIETIKFDLCEKNIWFKEYRKDLKCSTPCTVNNAIKELAKNIAKEKDDYIFNWLEQYGFNPERTETWITNFKKELEKEGKYLRFEVLKEKINYENKIYSTIQDWICFIDDIDNPIDVNKLFENYYRK